MSDKKGSAKKQYPFPRSVTKPITGPAYIDGMSVNEAKKQWYAYLRVVSNITPMHIPPLNMR